MRTSFPVLLSGSFTVPESVSQKSIEEKYENGILETVLPEKQDKMSPSAMKPIAVMQADYRSARTR